MFGFRIGHLLCRREVEMILSSQVSAVITSAGSRPKELRLAIESVRNQSTSVGEIILVWDCPKSESNKIIFDREGIQEFYTEVPFSGPSTTRNIGIMQSSKDFISFLDDDDLWFPKKIEKQLEIVNQDGNTNKIIIANCLFIDQSYKIIGRSGNFLRNSSEIISLKKMYRNLPIKSGKIYIPTSSIFMAKQLAVENLFNIDLKIAEDIEFMLRNSSQQNVIRISTPLVLTLIRKKNRNGQTYDGFELKKWINSIMSMPVLESREKGNILLYFGTKRLLYLLGIQKSTLYFIKNLRNGSDITTIKSTFVHLIAYFFRNDK